MLTAAAGMHVEPNSPLDSSVAAMWFLPILNMGRLPLPRIHFQVSGILAPGGDGTPSCPAGRLGRYCGKPRSPLGELMSRGQGQVHVGSGVNKSPAGHLFGRQKTLRKQTESLQRGERG